MAVAIYKRSRLLQMFVGISLLASGLLVNVLHCALYLGLKPFNKQLYRKIGYYLCYTVFCQYVFLMDWWSGSKMYITVDEDVLNQHLGKEHAFLLMNHTYEIDWLVNWVLGDKMAVLGNCKAFAKKSLQYIPGIGFTFKFAESVFLERSFDKDKENIKRQLNEIFDYPDPTWLLLDAEGTRFTPAKHIASQKFAAERGLPLLKHHLTPRTKGFTACVGTLKAKCPAIYDFILAFKKDDENQPTISNLISGRPVEAHMYIRRIPMSEVPVEEKEATKWLQNLYVEKDKMMERFFQTGSFTDSVKPIALKPRLTSITITLCWMVITLTPILYYLSSLLLSGDLILLSIGVAIITACYLMLNAIVGMSKISKASTYGVDGAPHKNKNN